MTTSVLSHLFSVLLSHNQLYLQLGYSNWAESLSGSIVLSDLKGLFYGEWLGLGVEIRVINYFYINSVLY